MTDCKTNDQLNFSFFQEKELVANFSGGDISSDSGLLLIRKYEEKIKYFDQLTRCIDDRRDQRYINHSLKEMLRQRVYQILAGYEDCNDADYLRHDSTFKTIVGRLPDADALSSQPTLSRLENDLTRQDVIRIMNFLVENYISSFKSMPKEIVIDIDSTDDEVHGNQQLNFFHGYYDQYQYLPLIISANQHLLAAALRPGTVGNMKLVIPLMKKIIKKIRQVFPGVKIIIRADGGFSSPRFYDFLEKHDDLIYYCGIGRNPVLERESGEFERKAKKLFEQKNTTQQVFGEFSYSAKSWETKQRRVIVKAEHTTHGRNLRYLVTNNKTLDPEAVYDVYRNRGESERWIGELKNNFSADRLSCHDFLANQVRLLFYALAYELKTRFNEEILKGTDLWNKSIDTIRKVLIKIGAWIKQTSRKIYFYFASGYPYQNLFMKIHKLIIALE